MTFSNLGLSDGIVRAVTARGYTQPTPIQAQAIPAILSGHDVLAGAQTGTGKTAGFTLPILQRLSAQPVTNLAHRRFPIRALILTPTRELAAQVEESVKAYGTHLNLKSITVFGGVNMNPQIRQLKGRVDILVATPGRLLDHVQQGTVDLSQVEILVLDEADRMLDMGFIRDIRRVLGLLPKQRQNLLFSATFSPDIKALAQSLLHEPVLIEVPPVHPKAELISQKVYRVASDRKSELLTHLIKQHNWYQVLVFTRTKHGADRLSKKLAQAGITSLAIHGNKSQAARTRSLAQFKGGEVQVLVATDIAARGIDINELPMVINYELPNVPEDYVHRIGRTGRAGAEGEALSLVCPDEYKYLSDIEKLMKRSVPKEVIEGFEPGSVSTAAPELDGRRGGSGQRQGRSYSNPSASGKPKARNPDAAPRKSSRAGSSQSHSRPMPSPRAASERRKAH